MKLAVFLDRRLHRSKLVFTYEITRNAYMRGATFWIPLSIWALLFSTPSLSYVNALLGKPIFYRTWLQ